MKRQSFPGIAHEGGKGKGEGEENAGRMSGKRGERCRGKRGEGVKRENEGEERRLEGKGEGGQCISPAMFKGKGQRMLKSRRWISGLTGRWMDG